MILAVRLLFSYFWSRHGPHMLAQLQQTFWKRCDQLPERRFCIPRIFSSRPTRSMAQYHSSNAWAATLCWEWNNLPIRGYAFLDSFFLISLIPMLLERVLIFPVNMFCLWEHVFVLSLSNSILTDSTLKKSLRRPTRIGRQCMKGVDRQKKRHNGQLGRCIVPGSLACNREPATSS